MKAEEMFKKEGYKKIHKESEIIYRYVLDEDMYKENISFDTINHKITFYSISCFEPTETVLDVSVLKAVQKQIEELGW